MTTPDGIIIIISALAFFFSSLLRDDQLSKFWNAILAAAFLLIIVATYILLTTGFAGTIQGNTQYVILAVAGVASIPQVIALAQYIDAIPSPIAPKPVQPTLTPPLVRRASAAYMPPDNNTTGK